ncbi:3'(2'),5'-bisphosphate nucleotidase CysQ [Deinococcus aerophilus]|uniref:3'(2'),5'-bisphosphate nucleotidase CysQ n=1 Tax=Deinococcus aerophilus TaxID=522488 RepID=A0ABQ2GNA6_9DEIO|nr:3'(2'),5'-bisphosphate nucleotidase CysQ [Deinococcus aerophilus]GGM04930.1 3'(2'),5'-bisphosphate nucleotidase CysQ [Deinococcus aerophilus]
MSVPFRPHTEPLTEELAAAARLAREAGALLLRHLEAGLEVEHKTSADDPVTAADREASALITAGLAAAFPEDGLLSEEETDGAARLSRERVWIIDPIDGTKEYVGGSPDYCVSIGLAVNGEAVLGVVYVPATDELFTGVVGYGVQKNGQTPQRPPGPWRVAVSDTEYRRELHRHALPGMLPSGSIALKLARIAALEADVTFTMSPRSEWDIAAGDALLRAAGGKVRRRDGGPVHYNRPQPHLEQGLIAGLPGALEWLEAELAAHRLPTAHLGLSDDAPVWAALDHADQHALRGHPGVHLRHAGQHVLALLVVDPHTRQVERAEGDAFHLERLTRDVTRALGPLGPGAR